MGSPSRPQQRRKHTASNGVSTKNPYGDVVLSNGGKRKVFEVREYTEIFGGSSSIPVLDLSSLDERVGSGECRSSKLDYSDVFGGVRNDEVAVPYEVLVNGSSGDKSNPRVLSGGHSSSSKDSGSQHSSRKVKRASGEVAGQSVGGVQPPLILSSSSISRTNGDASNEKKHEASTHFLNGAPHLPKIDNDRPQPPLKREVSRTWSFSAGVGTDSKSGPSPGKSHDSSKLSDANEVNLKTQSFKVSPTAIHYSNLSSSKGPRPTNAPFSSEDDNSGKPAGLWSPPLFEEEFDENSPAAVSAAALKKAIDQAQECIRMAKLIMERKKEGHRRGSKSRRRGCWNDTETEVDKEAYASNECNPGKDNEESGPIFSSVDGKCSPPISRNNTFVNAVNAGVQGGSKIPELKKAEPEMRDKNLEAHVAHAETTVFPGFDTNEDLRMPKSGHGKVHNDSGFMISSTVLASNLGGQESVDQDKLKEPEFFAEVEEKQGLSSFERIHELERMTEETGQSSNTNSDQVKSPENIIELVESSHEQENVACKAVENFRISPADEVVDRNDECANVMEKNDKKFNELEIIDGEHLTCVSSKFGNSSAESCNVAGYEMPEQKEVDRKFQNYSECKENVYTDEQNERPKEEREALLWFESKEQQEEPLEKKFNEDELDAFPEIDGVQQKVTEAFEPEFLDQKQNHVDVAHAPNLPGKYNQSEVEERFIPTSEYETAEAIVVDEEDGADAQDSECGRDAHVIDTVLNGARKSKEDGPNFEMQQAEYEERMDETVDVNGGGDDIDIGNENHANDISTLSNQSQEACDVDFHEKAEDNQESVQSNREHTFVPEVTEAISPSDKDELEELGLEVNEMRGIESLHRSSSDEIFIENKLHNSFDELSSDSEEEGDVLIMHADPEEKENEDKDTFNPVTEIVDSAQEYAADLPRVFQSEPGTGEVDIKNAKKMPEQTSKCNTESPSDGLSAHNSEGYPQDDASIKDEKKDEVETFPNESTPPEEQSQATPDLSSESEENERSTEAGKSVETSLNVEKDKENIVETSTAEENDAKEGWQGYDINDQQQRIEAIRRGREREKEKLAAERAIREARERAFAEARERAERAAVERASAEARKRYLAEAQEKHERVAMEKQQADKASVAKLRAERAAVERATAEARERAIEKAMSHKTTTKARPQVERSQTDRWSNSVRNDGLKHSLSSSDLDSALNTESAQRTKARFEKNQRIADRVAQALEEKNKRDRLVQKEQAERDRIAEYLDADIKRWSMGKEGNLRALLSTLHYILGADSGWQPIPLTEIITTPAVKKAYRKATLCVHPDKLQQRGATIQQKYICEKIFDLLKAAWNRFNSEER